jgi:hypothetical protein
MDIDKLKIEFAGVSADVAYGKNISKHLPILEANIKMINRFLLSHPDNPEHPICRELVEIGYWLYVFRDQALGNQAI